MPPPPQQPRSQVGWGLRHRHLLLPTLWVQHFQPGSFGSLPSWVAVACRPLPVPSALAVRQVPSGHRTASYLKMVSADNDHRGASRSGLGLIRPPEHPSPSVAPAD